MKKLTLALLLCSVLLSVCQRQPEPVASVKDLPMTEANLAKVRTTAELTGEEYGCLQAYMLHRIITEDADIDSTVSIGFAIEQGRKLLHESDVDE